MLKSVSGKVSQETAQEFYQACEQAGLKPSEAIRLFVEDVAASPTKLTAQFSVSPGEIRDRFEQILLEILHHSIIANTAATNALNHLDEDLARQCIESSIAQFQRVKSQTFPEIASAIGAHSDHANHSNGEG